eukprot:CAMPEP_0170522170 /NCGR_PEP_ID=MMETSP0209-20121228/7612_1 /TAXON_ID=665100 ORGANISM="Litonotus pictus, Strain P1" /NCGR_SAMPLE_ID=MMETSP0209 /ASSEMBLY_ACC=CAM_ASM_000301 /LENGTH=189 /DNA_ID=CAMNT_0010809535 /DNA_START=17 /DNA_END=583 /DNA_ORIENTATION=+
MNSNTHLGNVSNREEETKHNKTSHENLFTNNSDRKGFSAFISGNSKQEQTRHNHVYQMNLLNSDHEEESRFCIEERGFNRNIPPTNNNDLYHAMFIDHISQENKLLSMKSKILEPYLEKEKTRGEDEVHPLDKVFRFKSKETTESNIAIAAQGYENKGIKSTEGKLRHPGNEEREYRSTSMEKGLREKM